MFADIVKILGIPLTCSKCQLSLRKNILEAVKSLQQFRIYFSLLQAYGINKTLSKTT